MTRWGRLQLRAASRFDRGRTIAHFYVPLPGEPAPHGRGLRLMVDSGIDRFTAAVDDADARRKEVGLNLYGAGLYIPIQTHCPAAEEAGAQSNRCQSTVGKHLSAVAPKADMPHRQQRLTERTGKGPGSVRHGRLSPVHVEIRSLSFVWAIGAR
jgi:hypothetical protein